MAAEPNNITSQLRFTGNGPVDYKLQPVKTPADLPNPFKSFNGQVVTVLDADGQTLDYIFNNGTWTQKDYPKDIDGGSF